MKSIKIVLLSFILLTTIGLFAQAKKQEQKADLKTTGQKLATTLYIIDNFYVDSNDVAELTEDAIVAMLKELDPHSAYISKDDVEKANEPLVGSFEGIGVTFQLLRDTILVVAPVSGGPSEKVGIMAGDKIVKIDGEDAFGKKINNDFVTKRLRGTKGSKVTVGIKRQGIDELLDFDIIRDKIPLNSINACFMLENKVGYIKLDRFAQNSVDEFEDAFKKLKGQKMKSLILDLRGNSGGYLTTAIGMVNEFLEKDKTVVFTEGLKSPKVVYNTDKNGSYMEGKLVVLIDEGSASASEIVSGAIQDWDRGVVIGRRSFGKGLVQRPFNLPDGSLIRLTTARYHTPTGRCIQRSYENGVEDYQQEMLKRLKNGEYYHADSIHFPDSLKYATLKNGRIVYGGGGIMPDIFIPVDTSFNSKLYTNLIRKGILNRYTTDYALANRNNIKAKYSSFEKFNSKFEVDDTMIAGLKKEAEDSSVEWNEEEFERSSKFIKLQVKALIAKNIWDMQQYYEVVIKEDVGVQKAMEVLNDNKKYVEILSKKLF